MTVGKFAIHYPSGQRSDVEGDLRAGALGANGWQVGVVLAQGSYVRGMWMGPGAIVLVDPRCYITCRDGHTHYNPRDHVKSLPRWARQWLKQNTWWHVAATP